MNDENEIALVDGVAKDMGSGNFMIFQTDEYGVVHSVMMTAKDLKLLLDLGMA